MRHPMRSISVSLVVTITTMIPALWFECLFDRNREAMKVLDSASADRAGALFGRNPFVYFSLGFLIAVMSLLIEHIWPTDSRGCPFGRRRLVAPKLLRVWLIIGGADLLAATLSIALGDVLIGLIYLGTLGPAVFIWSESS